MKKYCNFILLLLILVSIVINISCKKYLDKKPDPSLATPTTLIDLRAILDNPELFSLATPILGEASADNYYLTDAIFSNNPSNITATVQSIYKREMIDYYYSNDWAKSYFTVYASNLVLESLKKIPITPQNKDEWNRIKGTALFHRGYAFLNLAWNYAKAYDDATAETDLGIDLRVESDFNIPSVRSNVKATYDRILSDLSEAATLLPPVTEHMFRPSKAAASGTLARAYLSMRKYDYALEHANAALQIKSNLIDYNRVSNPPPNGTLISGTLNTPFAGFSYPNPPSTTIESEIVFYSSMTTTIGFNAIRHIYGKVDPSLLASYSSDDLRKIVFFYQSGSNKDGFRGTYSRSATAFFSGIAVDELMLIKAECLARKGQKDDALDVLNNLLMTRWKKTAVFTRVTANDASEALDKILIERRKELIWRGLRWMDIKRLNKEGRNIILQRTINGQTYTLQPNSPYYALKLPKDIIDQTGIPQN